MASLAPGQRLVTRDGAVYRWDGHVTGADAPSAAALRLAQKNRLAEIERETEEARDQMVEAEDRLSEAADAIRTEEARLTDARDRSRLSIRQLAEAREALAQAERASGDLIRRREVIEEAVNGLKAQIEEIVEQEETARIEMEETPDLSALDARLREAESLVARDRGLLAEARARFEGLPAKTRCAAAASSRSARKSRTGRTGRNPPKNTSRPCASARRKPARRSPISKWRPTNSRTSAAT